MYTYIYICTNVLIAKIAMYMYTYIYIVIHIITHTMSLLTTGRRPCACLVYLWSKMGKGMIMRWINHLNFEVPKKKQV